LELGANVIGLNNDDNYLVPGYLEQMVFALQTHDADLVFCDHAHAYSGWAVVDASVPELGNWLASESLIRKVKWEGDDFMADNRFCKAMIAKAKKVVHVHRPLFIKN
jgi:hypothetical protein